MRPALTNHDMKVPQQMMSAMESSVTATAQRMKDRRRLASRTGELIAEPGRKLCPLTLSSSFLCDVQTSSPKNERK